MEKMKVVIYCRVSSAKQVKEGNGLDSQEQICRSWAKQQGYVVENVFIERGISGASEDRPALEEMLAFLAKAKDKYIALFYDISRVARDTALYLRIARDIQGKGHSLATTQGIIENSPVGEFLATIQAGYSTLFRKENALRTKNNMREHAVAGFWILQPPTGYRREKIDKRIHLKRMEPTATFIQEALEGFANGRFPTQMAVLDFLLDKPMVSYCGKRFAPTLNFVKTLLTNDKYIGVFAYKPWDIPCQKWAIEPIISADIFQAIQNRLNGKGTIKPKKYNYNDEAFPLRRWAKCAVCGSRLTASHISGKCKKIPTYQCYKKDCFMCGKSIRPAVIHSDFEAILANITPCNKLAGLAERIMLDIHKEQTQGQRETIRARLAAVEAKKAEKAQAFNLLMKNADNPEIAQMCNEKINALAAEIAMLDQGLTEVSTEMLPFDDALGYMLDFVQKPLAVWQAGDYYQRQGVLNLCFSDGISYDREKKFGTPNLSPIFAIFNENHKKSDEWCARQDSNSQSFGS